MMASTCIMCHGVLLLYCKFYIYSISGQDKCEMTMKHSGCLTKCQETMGHVMRYKYTQKQAFHPTSSMQIIKYLSILIPFIYIRSLAYFTLVIQMIPKHLVNFQMPPSPSPYYNLNFNHPLSENKIFLRPL